MKKKNIIGVLGMFIMVGLLVACGNKNEKEATKTSESATQNKQTNTDISYTETVGKNVRYYTFAPDPVFGSTATIIEKEGKGLLVDTQFSTEDADKIVQVAKEKNISIDTIYISYSDPDYYFGTARIKETFPKAKVIATPATIKRIKETYKNKVMTWKETLKDKSPKEIIIPNPVTTQMKLENEVFDIFGQNAAKQTLYNKNDDLLLGGILISTGSHLFMADTKTIESQEQWVKDLQELEKLKPKTVIPGHFGAEDTFTPENIRFTKEYIEKFMEVQKESTTSDEIIKKMKEAYPNLDDGSLEMSAKVVTGEQEWE